MSIKQTFGQLPDFRNLGVMTRVLLAVNLAGLVAALLRSGELREAIDQFAQISTTLEPSLLAALVSLHLLNPLLRRLGYTAGLALVLFLTAAIAAGVAAGLGQLGLGRANAMWSAAYALLLGVALAAYFSLRQRAFSPALAEARLQALQARIRPHFLFNSINAVLSLMRGDPRRAETALEDMAELFRSVMTDNRDLVTLEEEIALTRRYLDLENLRLGDRLIVEWHVDPSCTSALVPPMLLQPLVENAVYHGIEPASRREKSRLTCVARWIRCAWSCSIPIGRSTSTGRAIVWRSPISASGWLCISMSRRPWKPRLWTIAFESSSVSPLGPRAETRHERAGMNADL